MGSRRRLVVLLVILAAAVAVLAWQRVSSPGSGSVPAGGVAGTPSSRAGGTPVIPDVALERLDQQRGEPARPSRNLFRFQPKAAPPPPVAAERPPAQPAVGQAPPVAPGPPPPPPIPLKLIGIVEGKTRGVKLAVLTDSRVGDTFFGAEGDVIDGRYRVVRIGVESVEMTYVDGRGHQTIRLSGQ